MSSNEETNSLTVLVEELTENLKNLGERQNSHYTDIMMLLKQIETKLDGLENVEPMEVRSDDDLYEEAKEVVIENGKASTSYLQRSLGIGYTRAANIMDKLEAEKIIGPGEGATPREVRVQTKHP